MQRYCILSGGVFNFEPPCRKTLSANNIWPHCEPAWLTSTCCSVTWNNSTDVIALSCCTLCVLSTTTTAKHTQLYHSQHSQTLPNIISFQCPNNKTVTQSVTMHLSCIKYAQKWLNTLKLWHAMPNRWDHIHPEDRWYEKTNYNTKFQQKRQFQKQKLCSSYTYVNSMKSFTSKRPNLTIPI